MWGLIPPTKAALEEHVKRAAHQGGHVCVWSDTTNQGSSGGACQEGSPLGRPCVWSDTANQGSSGGACQEGSPPGRPCVCVV